MHGSCTRNNSRADALARHLAHLASTGKSSAMLRGTPLVDRMAEKLLLPRPTVCPILWAITAGAGGVYNFEPPQLVWGTLGMLGTMATAVRSKTDFAVLALTVFTVCHSLQVGDAAGIDTRDVSERGWITFYDHKTKRRLATSRAGVRDGVAQGPILATLLGGRARILYGLPPVWHPMGRSRMALLEATL